MKSRMKHAFARGRRSMSARRSGDEATLELRDEAGSGGGACPLRLTCLKYRMLVLDAKRCQTVCVALEGAAFHRDANCGSRTSSAHSAAASAGPTWRRRDTRVRVHAEYLERTRLCAL